MTDWPAFIPPSFWRQPGRSNRMRLRKSSRIVTGEDIDSLASLCRHITAHRCRVIRRKPGCIGATGKLVSVVRDIL